MWEIMTMGGVPYPSIDSTNNLFDYLRSGNRMEKPPECSMEVYLIMRNCWSYDPNDRPVFSDLVKTLHDLLMKSEKKLYPNASNLSRTSEFSMSSDDSEDENDILLRYNNDAGSVAMLSFTEVKLWDEEETKQFSSLGPLKISQNETNNIII
ncbi:fibroblast growth factor receptor homolog 1-like [Planococcus citri]|uniref:fibroblast growth factor receptor homolog 1-like n=1 Tax=Planococcus citri TaxID=170843 RepID=UPI0031FA0B8A